MPKFTDTVRLIFPYFLGSAGVARNSELLTLYVPSHEPSTSQNERETTLDTNYAAKAYCCENLFVHLSSCY